MSPRLIRLRSSLKKEPTPRLRAGSNRVHGAPGREPETVVAIAMTQLYRTNPGRGVERRVAVCPRLPTIQWECGRAGARQVLCIADVEGRLGNPAGG